MQARDSRWWALAGPLFAVVFFVATMLPGDSPGEKASGAQVMAKVNDHRGLLLAGVFLTPALAALLLGFFGYLRGRARDLGSASGVGQTLMTTGAVIWAGGMLLGAVLELAMTSSSDHGQAQVAQTVNVLNNDAWLPFIAGVAIALIGAGMTVLSTRILPAWLGWVALVLGVISLLGPGGFLGFFLSPLWILVAGIMLFVRRDAAVATTTA
jgi:hypothetical protein